MDQLPPGPALAGPLQTLAWVVSPVPLLERARARYGPTFTLRLGPMRNVVVVSDEATVREVFTGDPNVLRMGNINGLFRPILGSESILLLDGAEHLRHRRLLLPPFHGPRIKALADVIAEVVDAEIDRWPARGSLALLPRMQAITVAIIMRVVFGLDEGPRHERLRRLLPELLDRCCSYSTMLPWLRHEVGGLSSWGRLMRLLREIDTLLFEEIERRRRCDDLDARDDVLSLLLSARDEDGRPLDARTLRDELLTLLVSGHETTAGALTWTFERLVRHPDALERLQHERDQKGPYLEAVIHEALRLRPPLPIVARKLSEPTTIGGRTLPARTVVMPCVYLLHRDAALYPDPEAFRPERFLGVKPGTYRWIPFGGGVRRCLGASLAMLEMRIVIRSVLDRLRMRVPALRRADERIVRRSFTFAPQRSGRVVVERLSAP